MPVNQLLVDQTIDFISNLSTKAIVTIDGVDQEFPFYKVVKKDNQIKKYVYLQSETGYINEARIVDSIGRNLETHNTSIQKGEDGFMIVFLIELVIKGGIVL
ncbi:hypothetical protein [Cytobacillus sp. IB215665]|uniref:hypothetical protein n=1 Tax=Cytobacillus sp. IB215665 TaxID=3097357 RepID=UPI002A0F2409|nr:hypothetical protein [Cytobacillus sp. IB215665]MDX8367793.1 hypothetical protein [Cytobacillus sp. IB215665]